jgi:NAD(P)-dependent dehydrogenase (short-subunit alcohol dehydrogenase family)
LGLAAARALIQEGCRVTICARGEAALQQASADLESVVIADGPGRVLAVAADLFTAEGVETVIRRTVETFGGLDILVNNVGVAKGAGIADTSDATQLAVADVSLATDELEDDAILMRSYADPEYADTIKQLSAELERLMKEIGALPDKMPLDEGILQKLPDKKIQ